MGIYDGMSDASLNGSKYPSLEEGTYELDIDKILYLKTRAGYPATIAEFTVVKSTNAAHPEGVKRSWFQKMNVDAALGAVLGLGCGLAGIDTKDAARVKAEAKNVEQFMNLAVGADNPCQGLRVGVTVVKTELKNKPGSFFPKHEWFPVEQPA